MSVSNSKVDKVLDGLDLNESADRIIDEAISGSLGKIKENLADLDIKTETKPKAVVVTPTPPRYNRTDLADVATDVYKKNIKPPDLEAVEKKGPIKTPSTIASRANTVAIARSLAGLRSSGNEGKPSFVGPNGSGNVGKFSPTGVNGVGNTTNNVNNYYALTTDMTLEEYEDYVDDIFNEGCGDTEPKKPSKKNHGKACGCKKCDLQPFVEDMVLDLQQKLVTLGSTSWIEVDKILRETAAEYDVAPRVLSHEFKDINGSFPDKWIKENLEVELCGFMPIEEAVRLNKVGTIYEVTFMYRGGTNRLKFFWPSPGEATKEDMQREVEKFWPKGRVLAFYPTIDNEQQSNYMVMAPPMTENYHFIRHDDWEEMNEGNSYVFDVICEEEGEPLSSPEAVEDGNYKVHIVDHDTGEERVVFFGEGWQPKDQAKVDKKIGKVADAEAIERGKSKKYGRDDAKIDKLYKRQQAMRFGKKMSQIGEGRDEELGFTTDDVKVNPVTPLTASDHAKAKSRAKKINKGVRDKVFGKQDNVSEAAYPGHDEQGNPLPKEDKRKLVTNADKKAGTLAYKRLKKGDPRYKGADHLGN